MPAAHAAAPARRRRRSLPALLPLPASAARSALAHAPAQASALRRTCRHGPSRRLLTAAPPSAPHPSPPLPSPPLNSAPLLFLSLPSHHTPQTSRRRSTTPWCTSWCTPTTTAAPATWTGPTASTTRAARSAPPCCRVRAAGPGRCFFYGCRGWAGRLLVQRALVAALGAASASPACTLPPLPAPAAATATGPAAHSRAPPLLPHPPLPPPPPGDCDFKMELLRGNVALRGQFQKCVRRRAELSGNRRAARASSCGLRLAVACARRAAAAALMRPQACLKGCTHAHKLCMPEGKELAHTGPLAACPALLLCPMPPRPTQ